jgi:hypothetical protein
MQWFFPAVLVALAILGPLFGTDTRDGLSWARGHFWLPRTTPVKSADSPAPAASDHASADHCRTVPACG